MNHCLQSIWIVVVHSTNIDEACQFMSSEPDATCILDFVIAMIHSGNSQMDNHLNFDVDAVDNNQGIKEIFYKLQITFVSLLYTFSPFTDVFFTQ